MSEVLYDRLGGEKNVKKIANSLVDYHCNNPAISTRFENVDIPKLKEHAVTFIAMGTGGPNNYKGRDMLTTHKGMNASASEFMAVLDDALNALIDNGVGQREQEEILFILYSMRSEIVRV